jgi:hypothetical protein
MKAKLIVTSLLVAGIASPAFAASFYVVQSTRTHKCTIATKQPSEKSKTVVLVGDGTVYASKKEATDAMTTIEACKAT